MAGKVFGPECDDQKVFLQQGMCFIIAVNVAKH
jgi:hypothetical protein